MMKKRYLLLILCSLLLDSVSEALACGSCMYINSDRILPPITGWVALSLIWSFSLSIYAAITGIRIWGVYGPLRWLITVSILYIVSTLFTGPIFLLLFIFPGILLFLKAFLPNNSMLGKEDKFLWILNSAGIAGLMILITMTASIKHERTDADFILKYENFGPGKMALERLISQTPAQLNDLREIVLKGKNGQTVAKASEGIAAHGDPVQDAPLLLNIYEKIYGNDGDEKIELALSKLTGLTLPEGSPPEEWKRNWNLNTDIGL